MRPSKNAKNYNTKRSQRTRRRSSFTGDNRGNGVAIKRRFAKGWHLLTLLPPVQIVRLCDLRDLYVL
jgi:hypothetical protein